MEWNSLVSNRDAGMTEKVMELNIGRTYRKSERLLVEQQLKNCPRDIPSISIVERHLRPFLMEEHFPGEKMGMPWMVGNPKLVTENVLTVVGKCNLFAGFVST